MSRTASRQAALTAPDAVALHNALERTPAEVLDEEKAERRRSRMRILRRHQPGRHAAEGGETDGDAETAAMEFREMRQDEPPPAPAPRRTGPQPVRATGPQQATRATGPQFIPHYKPRHLSETERILAIARHRADRVPVPEPPAITSAAAFAENADRIGQLPLPGCDAADGYGNIPAHVAYMRRVSYFTGTTSRFDFPAAWPLPVAPQVTVRGDLDKAGFPRGLAVTAGDEAPRESEPSPAGLPDMSHYADRISANRERRQAP